MQPPPNYNNPQYNYGPPPPYGQQQPPPAPQSGGYSPQHLQQQQQPFNPAAQGYQGSPLGQSGPPSYPQQQGQQMPHVGSFPGPMQANMYAPQPAPFLPAQPQQQQAYGAAAYPPPPPSTGLHQAPHGPAAAEPMLGGNFMANFSNPMTLMTGGLLAAPQQYMQQRVSWIKTNMTGGTMSALFNINNSYVANKLLMLLVPFLSRWTYARMHEQIAGGQRYRPPSVDVNAPDLFIPLMGLWSYALLSCVVLAFKHTFKPDMMSNTLYSACFAWGLHWVVARLLLRGLNVPGVAWSELLAYTGYPFVLICITTIAGFLAGKWGYYALGAYGSLCSAVFMVKTMKRVIFQETRTYGTDMRMANYLLLALAAFQFPFAFWLAYRPV